MDILFRRGTLLVVPSRFRRPPRLLNYPNNAPRTLIQMVFNTGPILVLL